MYFHAANDEVFLATLFPTNHELATPRLTHISLSCWFQSSNIVETFLHFLQRSNNLQTPIIPTLRELVPALSEQCLWTLYFPAHETPCSVLCATPTANQLLIIGATMRTKVTSHLQCQVAWWTKLTHLG